MLSGSAPAKRSAGFTLTELMVGLAVFAILISAGLPQFRQMLQNYQVRVAAESAQNGLQLARAQAVANNRGVYFQLGAGTSWTVDFVTNPGATPIATRSSAEGSPNVTYTATAADHSTAATIVWFNNLGQIDTVSAGAPNPPLQRAIFTSTGGGNQVLRVVIGVGGNAKVCDPSLPSTNVRYCNAALGE